MCEGFSAYLILDAVDLALVFLIIHAVNLICPAADHINETCGILEENEIEIGEDTEVGEAMSIRVLRRQYTMAHLSLGHCQRQPGEIIMDFTRNDA